MSNDRSPRYPSMSLKKAIDLVEKVHDKAKIYVVAREAIAKDLGFKSLHGTAVKTLATLTSYGLLSSVKGKDGRRVSDLAVSIITPKPGDPKRAEAVEKAALTPKLFAELQAQYPDGIPSENTLRSFLVEKGFLPEACETVISVYQETWNFVEEERSAVDDPEPVSVDRVPVLQRPTTDQPIDVEFEPVQAGPQENTMTMDNQSGESLMLRISPTSRVQLAFSGHVTRNAIDSLIKQLEVTKTNYPDEGGSDTSPPLALEDGTH